VPNIPRSWLNDLRGGVRLSENTPAPWVKWINGGAYTPLQAIAVTRLRSRARQLPADDHNIRILKLIVSFFKEHPDREYAFERGAGELVRMMDSNVREIELTRFWRDGGRDGLGKFRIGTKATEILVDFALEAKCKEPSIDRSSGVRETIRLISRATSPSIWRLRHDFLRSRTGVQRDNRRRTSCAYHCWNRHLRHLTKIWLQLRGSRRTLVANELLQRLRLSRSAKLPAGNSS
jgi:hypothetical protein